MDILRAACGRNRHWRKSRASSKRVEPVEIQSKNRGIAVEAQFRAPFQGMGAARIDHILLELEDVSIGTEKRSVCGNEAFKQPIAEGDCGLLLVAGDEQRCASNVAQSNLIAEVRSGRARIFYCGISLVIEELHAKIGIKRGLIRVCGWPGDLIAAETQE